MFSDRGGALEKHTLKAASPANFLVGVGNGDVADVNLKEAPRTMISKTGKADYGKASFRKMGFKSQLNHQPQ
jgi:hypothetical protein